MRSPESDESDDMPEDNDMGDDPFSFKARSFNRKGKPIPASDDEADEVDSSDDDGFGSLVTKSSTRKPPLSVDDMLNDDDDSDLEIEVIRVKNGQPPASAARSSKPHKSGGGVDDVICLDSDDDSDFSEDEKLPPVRCSSRKWKRANKPPMTTPPIIKNREAVATIEKARQAREQLQKAQRYHAEDVIVPVISPFVQSPLAFRSAAKNPATIPVPLKATSLGPKMILRVRTTAIVNGKAKPSDVIELSIRSKEKLQLLMKKFNDEKCIQPTITTAKFTFDGDRLDPNKTPSEYEMEDEDLIDVVTKTIAIPQVTSKPSRTAASATKGRSIMLILRTQQVLNGKRSISTVQDILGIKEREPFQKLLEKYKRKQQLPNSADVVMNFDGEPLDVKKTPKDFEMEDEDIIDVTLRRML